VFIAFRTNDGMPWVLPVVKYVEAQVAIDPLLDHEYLPILGLVDFCDAAMELCLGKDSIAIVENRVRNNHYVLEVLIVTTIVVALILMLKPHIF